MPPASQGIPGTGALSRSVTTVDLIARSVHSVEVRAERVWQRLLATGLTLVALLDLSCQGSSADVSPRGNKPDEAVVRPAGEVPPRADGCATHAAGSRLYLADRPVGPQAPRLIQIDPLTLADLPDCPAIEPGSPVWKLSADGSTLVTYESSRRWNTWTQPEQITFVVRDASTGAERGRFHPPEVLYLQDVSSDGSRVLLSELGFGVGPSRWFMLDEVGEPLATFQVDEIMASWGRLWRLDPYGRQLVRLIVPRSDTEPGPSPEAGKPNAN